MGLPHEMMLPVTQQARDSETARANLLERSEAKRKHKSWLKEKVTGIMQGLEENEKFESSSLDPTLLSELSRAAD